MISSVNTKPVLSSITCDGDVREAAGLGSPPSTFTTNSSESMNAELKRKVNYKESEWPVFNKHIEQLVESQRDEFFRALSDRGKYRLLPECQHLGVPIQDWMKMRSDQHQKIASTLTRQPCLVRSHPQLKGSWKKHHLTELSVRRRRVRNWCYFHCHTHWMPCERRLNYCQQTALSRQLQARIKRYAWFCHTVL